MTTSFSSNSANFYNETTSMMSTSKPPTSVGMWILVGIVVALIVVLGLVIGFSQMKCSRYRWKIFNRFRPPADDQDILEFEQPDILETQWSPRIDFT